LTWASREFLGLSLEEGEFFLDHFLQVCSFHLLASSGLLVLPDTKGTGDPPEPDQFTGSFVCRREGGAYAVPLVLFAVLFDEFFYVKQVLPV